MYYNTAQRRRISHRLFLDYFHGRYSQGALLSRPFATLLAPRLAPFFRSTTLLRCAKVAKVVVSIAPTTTAGICLVDLGRSIANRLFVGAFGFANTDLAS